MEVCLLFFKTFFVALLFASSFSSFYETYKNELVLVLFMDPELKAAAEVLIAQALKEDIGPGDCTTQAIIPQTMQASAELLCKQDAVVCGLEIAALVFQKYDSHLTFSALTSDGTFVQKGTVLATIKGSAQSLLSSERIAVNFLQHLSGIATTTKKFKDVIAHYPVQLLDTRKTLPGYRAL